MVKVLGVVCCMEVKRGLYKDDIRRLDAFEMWIWRRMMKVQNREQMKCIAGS